MEWYHFLIALGACFVITCAEVLFQYSIKRCVIVYTSIHFLYWLFLNIVVGILIFLANLQFKFIADSEPYTLAVFIGISGFLLVNSNMKLDNTNVLSSFKSFFSQQKSKMHNDLNLYIKDEYPRKLATSFANCFVYEEGKIEELVSHIKMAIKVISKGNDEKEKKYLNEINAILKISDFKDSEKVFFLSFKLFDIDSSPWIKKDILKKFCRNKRAFAPLNKWRYH